MKRYVLQCFKKPKTANKYYNCFKKGQYMSQEGFPTNNLQKAYIYDDEDYDNIESSILGESYDDFCTDEFFRLIEIKLRLS